VAEIYLAGVLLEGSSTTDDLDDRYTPTPAEWQAVFGRVDAVEHVGVEVADAVADIWRDVARGLRALADGAPESDVAWEWKFHFESHWGVHALEALTALHEWVWDG
jgi:hypothetical protein